LCFFVNGLPFTLHHRTMPPKGKSKALPEVVSPDAPLSPPAPATSIHASKDKGKASDVSKNVTLKDTPASGSGISLEENLRSLRTTFPDSGFIEDDSYEELEFEVKTEAFHYKLLPAYVAKTRYSHLQVSLLREDDIMSIISKEVDYTRPNSMVFQLYWQHTDDPAFVLARVVADRMKKVLTKVISPEQYSFLSGRRLINAMGLVADIIDTARNDNEDWFLLLVDFKKAFDSVSRGYLFRTLRSMGFPERLVNWVEGLHKGTQARLLVNGWMGDGVEVVSGVRQGCPLAPYLFLCAVEPLAQLVIKQKLGISKAGERLVYIGYAYDTTLILEGKKQLIRAEQVLAKFERTLLGPLIHAAAYPHGDRRSRPGLSVSGGQSHLLYAVHQPTCPVSATASSCPSRLAQPSHCCHAASNFAAPCEFRTVRHPSRPIRSFIAARRTPFKPDQLVVRSSAESGGASGSAASGAGKADSVESGKPERDPTSSSGRGALFIQPIAARLPVQPHPSLINDDLVPTLANQRTFDAWHMASLWVGLVVGVPTWYLAATLVEVGMAWWQGLLTVLAGNLLVLIPMLLNGHPGCKYGVPFPVLARAAFGVKGANLPSLLRGLVACGWFGIQTWIGGSAILQLVMHLPAAQGAAGAAALAAAPNLPGWFGGVTFAELGCFLVFWAGQLGIVWRGIESIRHLESASAPVLLFLCACLLAWAYSRAGGLGPMLSAPSLFAPGGPKHGQFWETFFPALTANVGFWATLSLNIPDFTRYSRSQASQAIGQALGLPVTMVAFAFVGLAVTSATLVVFGPPAIPDPVLLLSKIPGLLPSLLACTGLCLATLTTNIAANVVAPANALVNLAPRRVSFAAGATVTALAGLLLAPWRLVRSGNGGSGGGGTFFAWLVAYSALLGPIAGVLVADYFLLRKTELDVDGLYSLDPSGPYWYAGGYNPAAVLALVAGVLPNLPGFLAAVGVIGSAVLPTLVGRVSRNPLVARFHRSRCRSSAASHAADGGRDTAAAGDVSLVSPDLLEATFEGPTGGFQVITATSVADNFDVAATSVTAAAASAAAAAAVPLRAADDAAVSWSAGSLELDGLIHDEGLRGSDLVPRGEEEATTAKLQGSNLATTTEAGFDEAGKVESGRKDARWSEEVWEQARSVVSFAGPAMGIWLSHPIMSLIDTAVVGQGCSTELAALGETEGKRNGGECWGRGRRGEGGKGMGGEGEDRERVGGGIGGRIR
ncbi:unnamed protein product, partial [Closterium sp. NIES-53]